MGYDHCCTARAEACITTSNYDADSLQLNKRDQTQEWCIARCVTGSLSVFGAELYIVPRQSTAGPLLAVHRRLILWQARPRRPSLRQRSVLPHSVGILFRGLTRGSNLDIERLALHLGDSHCLAPAVISNCRFHIH